MHKNFAQTLFNGICLPRNPARPPPDPWELVQLLTEQTKPLPTATYYWPLPATDLSHCATGRFNLGISSHSCTRLDLAASNLWHLLLPPDCARAVHAPCSSFLLLAIEATARAKAILHQCNVYAIVDPTSSSFATNSKPFSRVRTREIGGQMPRGKEDGVQGLQLPNRRALSHCTRLITETQEVNAKINATGTSLSQRLGIGY